jgi:hypothetical protein
MLAGLLLGACSPAPSVPHSPERPLADPVFVHPTKAGQSRDGSVRRAPIRDPFEYCAAVGTIDEPDADYQGPKLPESVIQAMIRQGILPRQGPAAFQHNAVWRCMGGKVWACTFGANLPCLEKADQSQIPTRAMDEFCAAHRWEQAIPAAVTGRATVYAWRCTEGRPQIGRRLFRSDPRGFLSAFWYELAPP